MASRITPGQPATSNAATAPGASARSRPAAHPAGPRNQAPPTAFGLPASRAAHGRTSNSPRSRTPGSDAGASQPDSDSLSLGSEIDKFVGFGGPTHAQAAAFPSSLSEHSSSTHDLPGQQPQRRPRMVRAPTSSDGHQAGSPSRAGSLASGSTHATGESVDSEATWGTPADMADGIHGHVNDVVQDPATPHPAQPPAIAPLTRENHQGPMGAAPIPVIQLSPANEQRALNSLRKSRSFFGRVADSFKIKGGSKPE